MQRRRRRLRHTPRGPARSRHARRRHGTRGRARQRALPLAAIALAAAVTVITVKIQSSPGASGASNSVARQGPVGVLAGTAAPKGASVPAGAVTVSPAPGSRTADPSTQISFLGRPKAQLGAVTVVGSRTGAHNGRLLAYSTGDGASFVPDEPFVAGETVTVHTSLPIAGADHGTFRFVVADVVPLRAGAHPPAMRTNVAGVQHFASAPGIEPPTITVGTNNGTLRGGEFLLAPKGPTGQAGPMIVRPDGQLVWFDPLANHQEAFDLNMQQLHGKRVLTWFQGEVVAGHGQGVAVIANQHYRTIAVVHGGNDVKIDLHDLMLTNRGTVFVTAYRTMHWDLRSDGGTNPGTVFDGVIQEIDIATGLVEEEWNSLDHVPVADSYFKAPNNPAAPFDYFHINGVQPLAGGDLLISSRNTSADYLVDPQDASKIVWRLGGKASSFSMGPGTRFWFAHDARLRRANVMTVFDNGSSPQKEPQSRALFLHLDLATHHVNLVRADVSTAQHVLAYALGNVQPLRDGQVVVGWGTSTNYSAFTSSGTLVYDATMPAGDDSYRAFFRRWSGRPTSPPSVAVSGVDGGASLAMSWNGATGVRRWAVLTGPASGQLRRVTTVPDAGFETLAHLQQVGAKIRVAALGANGKVLGRSAVVAS